MSAAVLCIDGVVSGIHSGTELTVGTGCELVHCVGFDESDGSGNAIVVVGEGSVQSGLAAVKSSELTVQSGGDVVGGSRNGGVSEGRVDSSGRGRHVGCFADGEGHGSCGASGGDGLGLGGNICLSCRGVLSSDVCGVFACIEVDGCAAVSNGPGEHVTGSIDEGHFGSLGEGCSVDIVHGDLDLAHTGADGEAGDGVDDRHSGGSECGVVLAVYLDGVDVGQQVGGECLGVGGISEGRGDDVAVASGEGHLDLFGDVACSGSVGEVSADRYCGEGHGGLDAVEGLVEGSVPEAGGSDVVPYDIIGAGGHGDSVGSVSVDVGGAALDVGGGSAGTEGVLLEDSDPEAGDVLGGGHGSADSGPGGGVVLKDDDGGEVVDVTSLCLLFGKGCVGVHVDPVGVVVGAVFDVPVGDGEVAHTGCGLCLDGSVGVGESLEEGQVAGSGCGGESVLGGGHSDECVPQEGLVHSVEVVVVELCESAVLVVHLGGGAHFVQGSESVVLGGHVVSVVTDGGGVASVAVVGREHASVDLDVGDGVAADGTDLVVQVCELVLSEVLGKVGDTYDVGQALVVDVGVVCDELVDVGGHVGAGVGGVLDVLDEVRDTGRGEGCAVGVGVALGKTDDEGGNRSCAACGQVGGGHGRGSAAYGAGDGTESAYGAGGIGVTVPGHEGTGLGLGTVGIPGGVHHAGIVGVDRVSESAEVVGVLVVGGGGCICGIHCGRGSDQADGHEEGDEGEEVECLLQSALDAEAAEGLEVGFEIDCPEHHDDECGGSYCESGSGDDCVVGAEPADEEAAEQPQHEEGVEVGFGVRTVLVCHPDTESQGEPDGQPSIVCRHGGDAGPAELVCEIGGECTDLGAAAVEECRRYGRCEHGENGRDGDDHHDGEGDGEHPGLLLEDEEQHAVDHHEDCQEAAALEDGAPQSEGDVVDGSDSDSHQQDEAADDDGGQEVLPADAPEQESDEHDGRRAGDDGPESGPGEDQEGQEHRGEEHVGPDGLVGEDLLYAGDLDCVDGLEGLHDEVNEPDHKEAYECILGSVGEGGRHDHEREQCVEHRCQQSDFLVLEQLPAEKIDRDAGERTEDGCGPGEGSCGRSCLADPAEGHDVGEGRDDVVEQGARDASRSVRVVDGDLVGRIIGSCKYLGYDAKVTGCTGTAGQGIIVAGGDPVRECEPQNEGYRDDHEQGDQAPVRSEP